MSLKANNKSLQSIFKGQPAGKINYSKEKYFSMQFTLGLLKPDLYALPSQVKQVQEIILSNASRLFILDQKRIHCTIGEARAFYKEHDGKPFQNRLVHYMSR